MKRFFRIDYKGQPRHVVEQDGAWRLVEGDLFGAHDAGDPIPSTGHRLLAPVDPSKLVCVGLNYRDHAVEQNKPLPVEPMLFLKPSTAVISHGDTILIPEGMGRIAQGFLEDSNVNVAEELVAMISAQRAYELTSKVVSAADDMLRQAAQVR